MTNSVINNGAEQTNPNTNPDSPETNSAVTDSVINTSADQTNSNTNPDALEQILLLLIRLSILVLTKQIRIIILVLPKQILLGLIRLSILVLTKKSKYQSS